MSRNIPDFGIKQALFDMSTTSKHDVEDDVMKGHAA